MSTIPPQVLVVNDSPFINLSVDLSLNQLFRVPTETVESGQVCLKMIKRRLEQNTPMYKLVLLDYYMPEMNGDEVTKKINDIFKDI